MGAGLRRKALLARTLMLMTLTGTVVMGPRRHEPFGAVVALAHHRPSLGGFFAQLTLDLLHQRLVGGGPQDLVELGPVVPRQADAIDHHIEHGPALGLHDEPVVDRQLLLPLGDDEGRLDSGPILLYRLPAVAGLPTGQ